MADASAYVEDIKKYAANFNQKAAEKIVGHLGIALQSRDSSLVSSSDEQELKRVREQWLRSKLKLLDNDKEELDAAISSVAEKMAPAKSNKSRVTFYYLLAEHFNKLDDVAA